MKKAKLEELAKEALSNKWSYQVNYKCIDFFTKPVLLTEERLKYLLFDEEISKVRFITTDHQELELSL